MKVRAMCLVLVLAGGCATTSDASEAPAERPSPEEAMAMMMEVGQPAEPHAEMAKDVGVWDVTMTMRMEPGGDPMEMVGTSTHRMILGGRYMAQDFRSTFMGQPYEGMLIMGYDNFAKEYRSLWIDSFSTGFMPMSGTKGADGHVHLAGVMKDPISPNGRTHRAVVRNETDDRQVMEMYDTLPDGTEWMVGTGVYTRRK